MTTELTEAMFWRQWPLTAQRFSLTPKGLRDDDDWCPLCAVCRDLGIEPESPFLVGDNPRLDFYLYRFAGGEHPGWEEEIVDLADNPWGDRAARRLLAPVPGVGA
jgi:hypothetical protein